MKEEEFYVLDEDYEIYCNFAQMEKSYVPREEKIAIKCPKCGFVKWEMKNPPKRFYFYGDPKKQTDHYQWSYPLTYVINKKFQDFLKREDIRGYALKDIGFNGWVKDIDIDVDDWEELDVDVSDLKELIPVSTCGLIRDQNGKIIKNCPLCHAMDTEFATFSTPQILTGASVNKDEWDGSDIFRFYNPIYNYVIVTEKFKNLVEKEKLTNVSFKKLSDYFRFNKNE